MEEPLERPSLIDEIVTRLEHDILGGVYKPGQSLPTERALAASFGVTRTSVKHALVQLEQLGLIRTKHGVGSIVQEIEESGGADLLGRLLRATGAPMLAEILEARTHVVATFVRLAATRRTDSERTRMHALLDSIEAAEDLAHVQKLENELVRLWARASRNRAFQLLANSVTTVCRLDLKRFTPQFADRRWLQRRLAAIVEAIDTRDGAAAHAATIRYFEEAARRLRPT